MYRTQFWKYGRWIGLAVVGVGTATTIGQCSSNWTPSNPSVVPDAGSPKWDFNWDK